jgi:riboflavin kinase/FMN adenylyltransferase
MSKKASVVTLGTFDGVHRGHQKILRKVVERAQRLKIHSTVLAFQMPPRLGHRPLPAPTLLTTWDDKLQILKRLGIDQVEPLVFNHQTQSTPAAKFFKQRILTRCGAREMVVGPRVAFGKNRAGKLPVLRQLGKQYGVAIHVVSGIHVASAPVSSSRIRDYLLQGSVEKAARQLGYAYSVAGKVVHGSHRGRHLGFPTANIAVDTRKILPPGVFWIKCLPASQPIPFEQADLKNAVDGLCNVGTRPTFTPEAKKLHCEAFLFKTSPSLYGKRLRIVFLRRIRPEKRFKSAVALQRQIARDFKKAQHWAAR